MLNFKWKKCPDYFTYYTSISKYGNYNIFSNKLGLYFILRKYVGRNCVKRKCFDSNMPAWLLICGSTSILLTRMCPWSAGGWDEWGQVVEGVTLYGGINTGNTHEQCHFSSDFMVNEQSKSQHKYNQANSWTNQSNLVCNISLQFGSVIHS